MLPKHHLRKLLMTVTMMSARPIWRSSLLGPMNPIKLTSGTKLDSTLHTSKSLISSLPMESILRTTFHFLSGLLPITTRKAKRDPHRSRAILTRELYSTWKWSSSTDNLMIVQWQHNLSPILVEWPKPSMLSSGTVNRSTSNKLSLSSPCSVGEWRDGISMTLKISVSAQPRLKSLHKST